MSQVAVRSRRPSSPRRPMSWTPIGRPSAVCRSGRVTAGTPISVQRPLKIGLPVDARPAGAGPGAAGHDDRVGAGEDLLDRREQARPEREGGEVVGGRDGAAAGEGVAAPRGKAVGAAGLVAGVAPRHLGEVDAVARRGGERESRRGAAPRSSASPRKAASSSRPARISGRPRPSRAGAGRRSRAAPAARAVAVSSSRGGGSGAVAGSPGSKPARASARSAASATVRAKTPTVSSAGDCGEDAGARDRPEARLVADDAAVGGRADHRAAGLGADGEGHVAGGDRRGRAGGRAAGRVARRRRVGGGGRVHEGELGGDGLAHDHRAGGAQPRDHGRVGARHAAGVEARCRSRSGCRRCR